MGLQRYYNRKVIFKSDHQKSGQNLKKISYSQHPRELPGIIRVIQELLLWLKKSCPLTGCQQTRFIRFRILSLLHIARRRECFYSC